MQSRDFIRGWLGGKTYGRILFRSFCNQVVVKYGEMRVFCPDNQCEEKCASTFILISLSACFSENVEPFVNLIDASCLYNRIEFCYL